MGHLTALKDLRQKGFVIPGSDGTVNLSEHIRRQRRSSGGRREPEAKAISTSPRHRRAYEGALRRLAGLARWAHPCRIPGRPLRGGAR